MSEIIKSPEFAQSFTVMRSKGEFVNGRWTEDTPTSIAMYGVILPVQGVDLIQAAEADRTKGLLEFFSTQPMYITRRETSTMEAGTSDTIVWHGSTYIIHNIKDYSDFGFYSAIATRTDGD